MTYPALMTGVTGGFLLCLVMLYPAIGFIAPFWVPGWLSPVRSDLLHGFLLMMSASFCLPVLTLIGPVAAWRSEVTDKSAGARAGALAGLVAGAIFSVGIVYPMISLFAYGKVIHFDPRVTPLAEAEELIVWFYRILHQLPAPIILIATIVPGLVGMMGGIIVGARQKATAVAARPTLLDFLQSERHPRQWFPPNESPVRIGLAVGGVIGIIYAIAHVGANAVMFGDQFAELMAIVNESMAVGIILTNSFVRALPILSPLAVVAYLVFGAVVVALLRNPTHRFSTRIAAVVVAAFAIMIALMLIMLRVLYFHAGAFLFFIEAGASQRADWNILLISPEVVPVFFHALRAPSVLVPVVFLSTWMFFMWTAGVGLSVGLGQGIFYSLVMPLFRKCPVDYAAVLRRKLRRCPDDVLPLLYTFFGHSPYGYEVLAHLATILYQSQPAVSRLAAAYHTMGMATGQDQLKAVRQVRQVLAENPQWHWSPDLGAIYAALDGVLSARTLEQILAIEQPPEQQTTSLPPLMVKSVQFIGRIILELSKIEKVADLPTKLIFLENSLAAIHTAERFVNEEINSKDGCRTMAPEQPVMAAALESWQELVITAIQRLKGRAYITCQLKNKQTAAAAQVPLIWEVSNQGLNVAQQLRFRLLTSEDFHVTAGSERLIEILSPGDLKEITLPVAPLDSARRLRVAWELVFDDAVDAARKLNHADVVEFVTPDKPFQRVFPIPYVTGTPLKGDQVFVGREDVFAFIRENLLGAHQNNVIILHGQRRTGKTSVLYRLRQSMSETHYGVLVDMQGKPARGEVDFLYSLADDITFNLEEHGIDIELPPRSAFEEAPEFFFRSRFLRALYPHLNGKNLLLLFDEFEEIQRRVEDGRLKPEIFQFLRNLMQHEERIDFVFSGTHKLEDLGAEYWSVLFNIAAYKPITFLSPTEVHRLMVEPVAAYNIEYDPLATEKIIYYTAGHPYFTQLLLHEMIVYHNETQRNYITVTDVREVTDRIVKRGEAHFKYIWAESTPEERQVLQAVAELLISTQEVNVKELRHFLHARGCDSADNWERALVSLEGRDILCRNSSRTALYRFKVDLIRLWIDRTRPAL
jgi:hypothetical protein